MDLKIIEKTLYLDIGDLAPVNLEELVSNNVSLPPAIACESDGDQDIMGYDLLRGIDYKDDYDCYEKIKNHLGFSEDLHILNETGHYLISQLKEKADPITHELSDPIVEYIYTSIKMSTKARNVGTGTFYNELLCVLDELLFSDVDDMDSFYLNETEYKLTSVYYGQEEWMEKYDIQRFQFSQSESLEEGEIIILMCYINDYTALIDRIQDHIDDISGPKSLTCLKVSKISSKISTRLDKIKEHLSMLLTKFLSS